MGSLAQKVDTLREQLGLVDGRPLAASVDEAVFQLLCKSCVYLVCDL